MLSNGKAIVEKDARSMHLRIPAKRNWFAIVFAAVWCFFVINVLFQTGLLQSRYRHHTPSLFPFAIFGIGVIFIVLMVLWMLFGKERLSFENNEVVFEQTIFGIGRKHKFQSTDVKNFRYSPVNGSLFGGSRWAFWGLGPGKIKFDYGMRTYSFALALDESEAVQLVQLLNEQVINRPGI